MENTEKNPQPRLERISERKFGTYEAADAGRKAAVSADGPAPAKMKIFRRNDGSFDLVLYRRAGETVVIEKPREVEKSEVRDTAEKLHGLTAKQRRSREKKRAGTPRDA